jgi:cell division septal protein FtsQ
MSNTTRHVQQDRHYWRRQGNLKVRKKRLTRKSMRWIVFLVFNAALAWAAYTACDRVVHLACSSPEFQLKNVNMNLVTQTSREELALEVKPFIHCNLFTLNLQQVADALEKQPWILEATVKRMLPCSIRIHLTERTAAALVRRDGELQILDRTGFMMPLEQLANPGEFRNLPVFTGLEEIGSGELDQRIDTGLHALELLRSYHPEWTRSLASLDLKRADRIGVVRANSASRLLLDPDHALRNFDQYLALREQIRTRIGPVRYYDLRWRDRITLMPDQS